MNLCSGCIVSAKEYASGQQGVFCNEHLGSCLLCSFAGGQCANRRLFITLFSPLAFPRYQNPQECLLIYVKLLEDGNGYRQVRIPDFECSLQMPLLQQGL
ncbi:unnamed protein product [Sphagnum troendelagicum]|uniref:Uncharacterized protein n=1 Tax=Sphagnum troendelagicum TaxID=128251 RepID=A0ABP0URG7_9BRYO